MAHVAFAAVFVALMAMITWQITPEVLDGGLRDTDDYTRLVRVRQLAESGAWFDGSIARSNWPFGETLHWTRPLDVVLLAAAGPLIPFLGLGGALHIAALVVPPVLLLGICYVVGAAATVVSSAEARWIAMIAVLAQPAVLAYGHPGRVDHHVFILLLFALSLTFSLQALADPSRRARAYGAGIAAGLGLWTSTEFLLPLVVLLGVPVVVWIVRGGAWTAAGRRWVSAFALSVAVAMVLERGPDLLVVEYRRVALPHVAMAILALAFWAVGELLERAGRLPDRRSRLIFAAGGGAACLAILAWLYPPFFRGPMVEMEHPVVRYWLSRVGELRPALMPTDRTGFGLLLFNAGAVLVALPYAIATPLKRRRERTWGAWLLLAASLALFLPVALVQLRWITYVQLVVPIVSGAIFVHTLAAVRRTTPVALRAAAVAGVAMALIAGPLVAGASVLPADPHGPGEREAAAPSPSCDFTDIARHLARDEQLGREPLTIAAIMEAGPAILYFTHHRVLATPYGNESGIVGAWNLMNATSDDRARRLVAARNVDLILLCPGREGGFFLPVSEDGDRTLYGRLLAGEPPLWLQPVDLPARLEGALLFSVVDTLRGPADDTRGRSHP